MNKLSHPARPDINWPYAEQLARALLEHHGGSADCRLVYAGPRPAGRAGGDQRGLTLMETLLVHQGKTCGRRRSARTEIFR
jgi:type VI secretion system protein VasL